MFLLHSDPASHGHDEVVHENALSMPTLQLYKRISESKVVAGAIGRKTMLQDHLERVNLTCVNQLLLQPLSSLFFQSHFFGLLFLSLVPPRAAASTLASRVGPLLEQRRRLW